MVASKRAYGTTTPFVSVFPDPISRDVAPTASEKNFPYGFVWIYTNGNTRTAYMYGGLDSNGDAVWILSGPGDSDVDTLTGDTGGAISPASGNITIAGGTNIATAGSGSTITVNMDAAITLATSVTSALYTTAAATDLLLTAATGQDIILKMGDNGGTNKVSFTDSDDAEVFAVDSNGTITFTNFSNSGTFTTSGGTASINASSNFNTVINSGTSTGTVTIGNALAGAIAIDTGAGISLDSVTASNFSVSGAADLTLASTLGSIPITAGEAAADAIVLNASDGAGGVQIQAGTGGILIGNQEDCTTIDVGDIAPTGARTITVGGGTVVTASVTDTIDIGPDGATTNADSVKTVNINTGGVTTGQVLTNIASGTITSGTHTVSIQTGNAAAGTVATNISTGTGTKTVTVGNVDAGTTFTTLGPALINDSVNANTSINTGTSTGTVTIGAIANTGAISVGTSSTLDLDAAGQIQINSSGSTIDIGNDAVAQNMNIGTGAAARTITIGNATGASSVVVDSGTGAASFGASATAHTTTIGSTTGASSTVIQAGTGGITMTGTVDEITANRVGATGVYIPSFFSDACAVLGTNAGGAPVGTTGAVNNLVLQGGNIMQEFVIGAGQTIIQPIMGTNGLIISGDETNTEGYEYNIPYLQYTIGTSAAFFIEVGLYINDMDGAAPYVIGFRKTEANNATFDAYTDYASIGMIAASSTTNVILATELNSAGQTVTDTTDAWGGDGSTNTLSVLVSASGVVTYTINGSAPSSTAAFTFDNTDVVIPFIRLTHSASPTDVAITSLKVGLQ